MEYDGHETPQPHLMPSDCMNKALCKRWLIFIAQNLWSWSQKPQHKILHWYQEYTHTTIAHMLCLLKLNSGRSVQFAFIETRDVTKVRKCSTPPCCVSLSRAHAYEKTLRACTPVHISALWNYSCMAKSFVKAIYQGSPGVSGYRTIPTTIFILNNAPKVLCNQVKWSCSG